MRYTALLLVLSVIAGWAANTTPVAPKVPADVIPVAQYINYQGVLDPDPGAWNGTFTIWDDPTSNNPVNQFWTGTYSIPSDPNGLYNVQLGSGGFPITTLPEGPNCWLEIAVNGTSLSPRTQLVTVPYAWNAAGLTSNQQGICRANVGNLLYGSDAAKSTHVNLGVISTTGTSGQDNPYCTVGGGWNNAASDTSGTVSGGEQNAASGRNATVGGGYQNVASGDGATIAGGGGPCHDYNIASGFASTIGGGRHQRAGGDGSFVGGGQGNSASGGSSTVSGGAGNCAYENYATIGGGCSDSAGSEATVGGGSWNTASGYWSTVGGGWKNCASGNNATVGGGECDTASGLYASVPGGHQNTAAGDYSFAGGWNVKTDAAATNTFAFGLNFTTSTPQAVVFYSGGSMKLGVGVVNPTHNIDVVGGAYCDATGWHNPSSRRLKHDISPLSPEECRRILAQLNSSEVVRFKYNSETNDREHIGLIAEDAPALLTDHERRSISTGDAIGCLLAALKAQTARIEALEAEVARFRK
jgi:hypothetical protein